MKKMQPWGHVQGKLSKDSLTSLELTDKQKCFFIFILNGVDNFFWPLLTRKKWLKYRLSCLQGQNLVFFA